MEDLVFKNILGLFLSVSFCSQYLMYKIISLLSEMFVEMFPIFACRFSPNDMVQT